VLRLARVRQGSIATLRAVTGRVSDYAAWLEPKTQTAAIGQWEKWLANDAKTAKLVHPLRPADMELGRTLMCLYGKNEVIEVDATGRQTFSVSEAGGLFSTCTSNPADGKPEGWNSVWK